MYQVISNDLEYVIDGNNINNKQCNNFLLIFPSHYFETSTSPFLPCGQNFQKGAFFYCPSLGTISQTIPHCIFPRTKPAQRTHIPEKKKD